MARNTPHIDDYGGHAYGHGDGRRRNRRGSTQETSHRCLDCKKLCFYTKLELVRASKPRCPNCGGPLEETDAQRGRDKKEGKTAKVPRREQCRCRACGKALDWGEEALFVHLMTDSTCRRDYIDLGQVIEFYQQRIIRATAHVERERVYRWILVALKTNGHAETLDTFSTLHKARDAVSLQYAKTSIAEQVKVESLLKPL